jgi:tubby and related proteins
MGVSSSMASHGFGAVSMAVPQFSAPEEGGFNPSTFGSSSGDVSGFAPPSSLGAGAAMTSTGLAQAFADEPLAVEAKAGARGSAGPVSGDVLGDSMSEDEMELAPDAATMHFHGLGGPRTAISASGPVALPAADGDRSHAYPHSDDSEDEGAGVATSPSHADTGREYFGDEPAVPYTDGASAAASSTAARTSTDAGVEILGMKALDMSNLREFLHRPLPLAAGIVPCYIERGKGGLFKGAPTYSLYTKEGDRFLLAARKRSGQRTSNYVISSDKRDLSREGPGFLGKLRGNFLGTEYVVYDDGASPEDKKSASALRRELALITYQSNVMGSRGPRKMKVAVPRVEARDNTAVVFRPSEGDDTMSDMFRAGHVQDMVMLINKPPKWNDSVKAFVLNFNGRVTMASVKNFQLVTPEERESCHQCPCACLHVDVVRRRASCVAVRPGG